VKVTLVNATVFKIILNSIYGRTKYNKSKLYCPALTYSVTINGQLILLEIMESLHCLFGLDITWVNTDGLILRVKRSQLNKVHDRLAELEIKFGISFGTRRAKGSETLC
jgi:DNA polymerase elongation subunit (family B)